jgi:hypothetical protein
VSSAFRDSERVCACVPPFHRYTWIKKSAQSPHTPYITPSLTYMLCTNLTPYITSPLTHIPVTLWYTMYVCIQMYIMHMYCTLCTSPLLICIQQYIITVQYSTLRSIICCSCTITVGAVRYTRLIHILQ